MNLVSCPPQQFAALIALMALVLCGTGHAASSYVLVPLTNVWKYDASGTNLGTAWVQTNYDDSFFPSGSGGLGNETDPTITPLLHTILPLNAPGGSYITNFYFRTHFILTNNPLSVTLTTSNQIDDGAVFYINGQEFKRVRIAAGPVTATTFASAATAEGQFTNAVIPSSMLVQGDNVLAVEVHQATATSGDIVFITTLLVDPGTNIPPTITAQPADTGAFPDQSVALTVSAIGSPVLRYRWFSNNVALSGATNSTLSFANVQADQAANYFVMVSNSIGVVTSKVASLVVVAGQAPLQLIEFTNTWRFNLSGSELGTGWRTSGYDDSTWPAAPGVLVKTTNTGFPELTNQVLALTNASGNTITTYYFRVHFTLPPGYDHVALLSSNLIDDGAIFHLNGLEAARVRIAAGAYTARTLATPSPTDGKGYDTLFIPGTNLKVGDNVVAAEVHQSSGASSDVVFGMQLRAYAGDSGPLSILSQPVSQSLAEGQSATLVADVFGEHPWFFQWFRNGVALPSLTNEIVAFTPAHPANAGNYYFIASNSFNAVTSAVATLTVTADVTPPGLLAAFVTNGLNSVLVIFSEAISAPGAMNPANYTFTPGVTVLGAQLLAPDRVLLTVTGLDVQFDYTLTVANIIDTSDAANPLAPGSPVGVGHESNESSALRNLETVFIILMENQAWADIKASPNCPYINSLLPQSSYCENYFGHNNEHPSQPNYLWLEAGSHFGHDDDTGPSQARIASTNHLVTQLRNAGIEWRGYMESMPYGSSGTNDAPPYYGRHNPFAFFDDVTTDRFYCTNHVRPYASFAGDLAAGRIGRYNFITPNITNDMHDLAPGSSSAKKQGDTWLALQLPQILNSPAFQNNGAVFITWDENDYSTDYPIGMIALSPLAKGNGYVSQVVHDHSSTLRTMQDIFGVGPYLADAANANTLADLFNDSVLMLSPPVRSNGIFTVTLNGALPGKTNYVQASSDLVNWNTISTNVATNSITIPDPLPAGQAQRFYRAIELP